MSLARPRKGKEHTPLLPETLRMLEEVTSSGVGLVEFGLHLVATDMHRVEMGLKHAELL
jgi:hypothetical protein